MMKEEDDSNNPPSGVPDQISDSFSHVLGGMRAFTHLWDKAPASSYTSQSLARLQLRLDKDIFSQFESIRQILAGRKTKMRCKFVQQYETEKESEKQLLEQFRKKYENRMVCWSSLLESVKREVQKSENATLPGRKEKDVVDRWQELMLHLIDNVNIDAVTIGPEELEKASIKGFPIPRIVVSDKLKGALDLLREAVAETDIEFRYWKPTEVLAPSDHDWFSPERVATALKKGFLVSLGGVMNEYGVFPVSLATTEPEALSKKELEWCIGERLRFRILANDPTLLTADQCPSPQGIVVTFRDGVAARGRVLKVENERYSVRQLDGSETEEYSASEVFVDVNADAELSLIPPLSIDCSLVSPNIIRLAEANLKSMNHELSCFCSSQRGGLFTVTVKKEHEVERRTVYEIHINDELASLMERRSQSLCRDFRLDLDPSLSVFRTSMGRSAEDEDQETTRQEWSGESMRKDKQPYLKAKVDRHLVREIVLNEGVSSMVQTLVKVLEDDDPELPQDIERYAEERQELLEKMSLEEEEEERLRREEEERLRKEEEERLRKEEEGQEESRLGEDRVATKVENTDEENGEQEKTEEKGVARAGEEETIEDASEAVEDQKRTESTLECSLQNFEEEVKTMGKLEIRSLIEEEDKKDVQSSEEKTDSCTADHFTEDSEADVRELGNRHISHTDNETKESSGGDSDFSDFSDFKGPKKIRWFSGSSDNLPTLDSLPKERKRPESENRVASLLDLQQTQRLEMGDIVPLFDLDRGFGRMQDARTGGHSPMDSLGPANRGWRQEANRDRRFDRSSHNDQYQNARKNWRPNPPRYKNERLTERRPYRDGRRRSSEEYRPDHRPQGNRKYDRRSGGERRLDGSFDEQRHSQRPADPRVEQPRSGDNRRPEMERLEGGFVDIRNAQRYFQYHSSEDQTWNHWPTEIYRADHSAQEQRRNERSVENFRSDTSTEEYKRNHSSMENYRSDHREQEQRRNQRQTGNYRSDHSSEDQRRNQRQMENYRSDHSSEDQRWNQRQMENYRSDHSSEDQRRNQRQTGNYRSDHSSEEQRWNQRQTGNYRSDHRRNDRPLDSGSSQRFNEGSLQHQGSNVGHQQTEERGSPLDHQKMLERTGDGHMSMRDSAEDSKIDGVSADKPTAEYKTQESRPEPSGESIKTGPPEPHFKVSRSAEKKGSKKKGKKNRRSSGGGVTEDKKRGPPDPFQPKSAVGDNRNQNFGLRENNMHPAPRFPRLGGRPFHDKRYRHPQDDRSFSINQQRSTGNAMVPPDGAGDRVVPSTAPDDAKRGVITQQHNTQRPRPTSKVSGQSWQANLMKKIIENPGRTIHSNEC